MGFFFVVEMLNCLFERPCFLRNHSTGAGDFGSLEIVSKVLPLVEVAPVKLQNLLHWRAALSAAGLLGASSPAAWAADEACPPIPTVMVFAYSCSQTSNLGDGVAIQISGGETR
jgi:hypothetical protein